jgi:asparagine N-glycosylation enzyme membrane subunit Stt3
VSERRLIATCGGGLFLLVLVAYIETMAGSTSFWDCGEFIATAYSLGIPHPPATPLYVVLGRVFTLLPLPLSVAQNVKFMSAFFGALGVVVVFFIIVDIVRERVARPKSALIASWSTAAARGALFTAEQHLWTTPSRRRSTPSAPSSWG